MKKIFRRFLLIAILAGLVLGAAVLTVNAVMVNTTRDAIVIKKSLSSIIRNF